jgi:hypothetical protein
MYSLSVVELHVIVNYKKYKTLHNNVLWQIYVTDESKKYVGLHKQCLMHGNKRTFVCSWYSLDV